MSLSTTAAARQNEMNVSIAVVAMRTFDAVRFAGCGPGSSIGGVIVSSKSHGSPKKQTAIERKAVYGRSRLDRALPVTPTGLADGLGLGSVLRRTWPPIRPN